MITKRITIFAAAPDFSAWLLVLRPRRRKADLEWTIHKGNQFFEACNTSRRWEFAKAIEANAKQPAFL
jgi:hypothetical protein